MRTRKRQFAVAQEATPGTVETFASTDVLVRIRDGDTIEPDYERFETEEVQGYSSHRPGLIGRRVLNFGVSYFLRGSTAAATAAAVSPMLEAAMLLESAVKSIAVGTITGGPYQNGETVTGAPSTATGRVFRNTSTTPLRYVPLTGTMASGDTITGAVSGASSTASAGPVDAGFLFEPTDSSFGGSETKHHVSAKLLQDGFHWTARGCLADLTMNFRNGHPCIVNQRFTGAYSSHGDQALYSISAYPEETVAPPRFLNVGLKLGAYSPTDVIEFTFEVPTNPEAREDANNSSGDGVLYADYQKDIPRIRFEPAMVLAATKDFFDDLADGTTFAMEWVLTGTTGNTWTFYADEAQLISVGAGDRRNLAVAPIEIGLFGSMNNEFVIWQH